MKLRFLILVVLLLAYAFPGLASAQAPSPEAMLKGYLAAVNNGDIEGALKFFADDAVLKVVPPPGPDAYVGKEQIRGRFSDLVKIHTVQTLGTCQSSGDQVTCPATVVDDSFKAIGIPELEVTGVAVAQGGLLKSVTWTVSPASLAKLAAATTPASLPKSGGSVPVDVASAVALLGALTLALGVRIRSARR